MIVQAVRTLELNMSVTFKAKSSIVSTNPTDFSVTAEGMANADASQDYDDIAVPVKKICNS